MCRNSPHSHHHTSVTSLTSPYICHLTHTTIHLSPHSHQHTSVTSLTPPYICHLTPYICHLTHTTIHLSPQSHHHTSWVGFRRTVNQVSTTSLPNIQPLPLTTCPARVIQVSLHLSVGNIYLDTTCLHEILVQCTSGASTVQFLIRMSTRK